MENNFVKKMTSRILRRQKGVFFDRNIMHPEREWFVGIVLGLLILAAGVSWGIHNYIKFDNINVSNEIVEEEKVIYRASLVEAALADSATRRESYDALKTEILKRYGRGEVVPVDSLETEVAPVQQVEGSQTESEPEAEVTNEVSSEQIIFE